MSDIKDALEILGNQTQSRFMSPETPAQKPGFDVGEAVETYFQEFPDMRGQVFIVDQRQEQTPENALNTLRGMLKAAAAGDEYRNAMVQHFNEEQLPIAQKFLEIGVNRAIGSFDGSPRAAPGRDRMCVILLSPDESINRGAFERFGPDTAPVPDTVTPDKLVECTFHHETAHALDTRSQESSFLPDKRGKYDIDNLTQSNFRECVADAYALIRHYQKHGEGDTGFGEFISNQRAMDAVMGDVSHYTSPTLDGVNKLARAGKLSGLSPQQSLDLATRVAEKTALGWDAMRNMKQESDTLRSSVGYTRLGWNGMIRQLGAQAEKTESPAFHKAAVHTLRTIDSMLIKSKISEPVRDEALRRAKTNRPEKEPAQAFTQKMATQSILAKNVIKTALGKLGENVRRVTNFTRRNKFGTT